MEETTQPSPYTPPKMPEINQISKDDIIASVKAGLADFLAAPLFGLFFGGIYVLGGLIIVASLTALEMGWMIIPVAIGFPLVGPFVAVGLYEVSRRRASGRPLKWQEILLVVVQQRERQFGWMAFVILCIFWIWLFQVRILFAIFLGFKSFTNIYSFIEIITTTSEGLGFLAVGSIIGAILAYVLFSSTIIAIPLLLDRDIDVVSAIITSFKTVAKNRIVLTSWGVVIAVLAFLALLPAFLGIIVVLPILGHTTWHLYTRAIVPVA